MVAPAPPMGEAAHFYGEEKASELGGTHARRFDLIQAAHVGNNLAWTHHFKSTRDFPSY